MNEYYMAGFLDGEGYISLLPKENKARDLTYYSPVVKIASTNFDILNEIRRCYGGYMHKRVFKNKNQKDAWCWEIKNKKPVLDFLEMFYRYMIVKQRNAILVMEYCKFPFGFSKRQYKNTYNENLVIRCDEIYRELKKLNHRGINTSND